MRTTLVLGTLLVLALPASADTGIFNPQVAEPTALYIHFVNDRDGYLSVLPPPGNATLDRIGGAFANSACIEAPASTTTLAEQSHHTFYAVVSPDALVYRDGAVTARGATGPSGSLTLTGDQAHLTWFIEAVAEANAENGVPVVVPEVVVRATLRMGDDLSVGNAAYNSGQLIARAETDATLLARDRTQGSMITYEPVDGHDVYRVELDLDPLVEVIPKDEGFNLRIDAFVSNPLCEDPQSPGGGDYLMPDVVHWYRDPGHQPRLDMPVVNPVAVDRFHGVFDGDELVLKADFQLAWGAADLDVMRIILPSGPLDLEAPCVAIQCHDAPDHIAMRWNLTDVEDGEHPVRFEIGTLGGHNASAELLFEVGGDGRSLCGRPLGADEDACVVQAFDKRSPSPVSAVVLAVAVVAMLRRGDQ